MKTIQAWGWLAAGVLALGLNGIYHDGGAEWAHRAADRAMARIGENTEGVLAMASRRADLFLAKGKMVVARNGTASCRVATAVAGAQTKISRAQAGFAGWKDAGWEEMSARGEAQMARFEADRARIEAPVARVSLEPAAFNAVEIPAICSRIRISVPHVRVPVPMVRVPMVRVPGVQVPQIRVEVGGPGPVRVLLQ
jgi:hypothetical protein